MPVLALASKEMTVTSAFTKSKLQPFSRTGEVLVTRCRGVRGLYWQIVDLIYFDDLAIARFKTNANPISIRQAPAAGAFRLASVSAGGEAGRARICQVDSLLTIEGVGSNWLAGRT
jgi:hypothetical protein